MSPPVSWFVHARIALVVLLALNAVGAFLPGTALAAPAEQNFNAYWVQNHTETDLWSGPDAGATSFGRVKSFSYFKVLQPQQGPRLYVLNPLTEGTAWITAAAVGTSGEPPRSYFVKEPEPVAAAPPSESAAAGPPSTPGRIVGGANVRSRPVVAGDSLLSRLDHNTPVQVLEQVTGGDGEAWYRIDKGQFVHHSLVRLPRPFPPHPGKVIDADLQEPVMVTAYEDGKPVYSALALKGKVAWGTPTGFFRIQRRVANETMDSATLGIPRDGPGGYLLRDVLFTQYFTGDGASLHYNYWSVNFWYAVSHGCLWMNFADS